MNNKPIFWEHGGLMHSCSKNQIHPGIWLVWTDCERDVPANKAFTTSCGEEPKITCEKCKATRQPTQDKGGE